MDDTHLLHRFAPVPRAARRRDGWTPDRQHAFVAALARLPSVAAASRSVGMSARSAHRLRASPGAEGFARAWDEALEIGFVAARSDALERATRGVRVVHKRRGIVVGTRMRYDDRLLLGVLNSVKAHERGRLPWQERLAYARAIDEADARLGGPADWGEVDRRHEQRIAERIDAEVIRRVRLALPVAPPIEPRIRRLI